MGGTWNRDGLILFPTSPAAPISRVAAEGGPISSVTMVSAGQVGHAFPQFLPDGRHFLYYAAGAPDARGVYVGQTDGSPSRRLIDADAGSAYTSGHILFIRRGTVYAQGFDAERLELAGSPFEVATGVLGRAERPPFVLSSSPAGFVFRTGELLDTRQFTRVDRTGRNIAPRETRSKIRRYLLFTGPQPTRLLRKTNGELRPLDSGYAARSGQQIHRRARRGHLSPVVS